MPACKNCSSELESTAHTCPTCGAAVPRLNRRLVKDLYVYTPHPRIAERKNVKPAAVRDMHHRSSAIERFNSFLAVNITGAVGTMWCAYAFAVLAFISLPEAIRGGTSTLIAWIAQTFLQLVLLSIIIVGQKVAGEASDKRALDTYNDAEAVLHEAMQIQEHLAAQDQVLKRLTEALEAKQECPPEHEA
jgi:hypothetical protein